MRTEEEIRTKRREIYHSDFKHYKHPKILREFALDLLNLQFSDYPGLPDCVFSKRLDRFKRETYVVEIEFIEGRLP